MNKVDLIATWLSETIKPEDATKFALMFMAEHSDEIVEFQDWLKAREAKLLAEKTPEALKAQELATKQAIDTQLSAITEAKVVEAVKGK